MNDLLFLITKAKDGGYTAKSIKESIFTEAETIEGLKINIKEAVECHYENISLFDVRIVMNYD